MKHHANRSKLGRQSRERRVLLVDLANALFRHKKIKTTAAKAKSLRPFAEKMITKAKNPTVANNRLLFATLGQKASVTRLVKEIAPNYTTRMGGYTRIIKLPARSGDASPMAFVELV